MPYPSNEDLPDTIKVLPVAAQSVWRKVFNDLVAKGTSEDSARKQAWTAVKNGWEKKEDKWVKKMELDTYELRNVEIFATGKWNGEKYTDEDLMDIVNNFNSLRDKHKPALKLGHEDKQVIAQNSGLPALGWIDNIKKVGNKLLADIVQIPKRLYELIKAGAYKKISSEIWWNLKYEGKNYRRALRAVALLGAEVPAVWDIGSIEANYSKVYNDNQEFKEVEFNMADGKIKDKKEEKNMDELTKKYEEAKKEAEEAKQAKEKAEAEKAKAEAEEKAKAEAETAKNALAEKEKVEMEAEAEKDNAFIDEKVNEGKIIPAQVDDVKMLMKEIDRNQVIKFTIKEGEKEVEKEKNFKEVLKSFISNSKPQIVLGETASGKSGGAFKDIEEAAEYYVKTEKMSYRDAVKKASKEHPTLVKPAEKLKN